MWTDVYISLPFVVYYYEYQRKEGRRLWQRRRRIP